MPHGLTPLGRQLRSVIAALGPPRHDPRHLRPLTKCWTRPTDGSADIRRARDVANTTSRHYSAAAAAAAAAQQEQREDVEESAHARKGRPTTPIDPSLRPVSRARLSRRRRIDHLGEELRKTGRRDVAPRQYPGRKDISHFNPRSRHGVRLWKGNQNRHSKDYRPDLDESDALSLTRILALYIRHITVDVENLHPKWGAHLKISRWDREILRSRGYDVDDLKVWADIIVNPDPYQAVTTLLARTTSHGVQAVPLPIFSYFLRRPYLSSKALRPLIGHAWALFEDLHRNARHPLNPDEVFVVFLRLARSARDLWPQALPSITDFLTSFMPDVTRIDPKDTLRATQLNSFLLNRAMSLVAHPTAQAPMKDNPHQEAAIVNILAYMANHDPPLQINRSGYRAVIRIQLAQKKTPDDRLWAELKALSWPPWKEDRNRMDSEVGLEYGVSKAGDTLRRMAEAGYAHEPWERVAKIYAGWDTDQTPTIQTRAILFGRISEQRSAAAVWAARIGTTRTLQEAWACYLACEDAKHSLDQDVLLAIFEKLAQEQRRLKKAAKHANNDQSQTVQKLLPGDAREVQPLPPSTHLYTHTSRQPPTLHEFFDQLDTQGVRFSDRTLAFRIAYAETYSAGVKHLSRASDLYPNIASLLTPSAMVDISKVPMAVIEAYVALLVKVAGLVERRAAFQPDFRPLASGDGSSSSHILQARHSLVHAVSLLQALTPQKLPPWNQMLLGLGSLTYTTHSLLITPNPRAPGASQPPSRELNVMAAYRLSCHVLSLLTSTHKDLDSAGFLALCHSTENVAIACWRALLPNLEETNNNNNATSLPPLSAANLEALTLLHPGEPQRRLHSLFRTLVGSSGSDNSPFPHHSYSPRPLPPSHHSPLPRLLATPGPAILHAYIRALGWCGAHEELLELVRWMVEFREEVEEAMKRDRLGRSMVRKAVVALRVFLERSWVDLVGAAEKGGGGGGGRRRDSGAWEDENECGSGDEQWQAGEGLRKLRARAPELVLQEVRELIESVEEWGGWPGNEAVERYVQNQRFEDAK